MSRQVEHTIEGVKFRITPFDAFRQLRLFGDLQKEILPAVGGVLNVAFAKDDTKDETRSDKATIEAFRDLSTRFDGATLEKWANQLLDENHITFEIPGREPQKLSAIHRGLALPDFAAVLELLYHVGYANFAGPLGRWAALSGLAQKLTASLSVNSPTSS